MPRKVAFLDHHVTGARRDGEEPLEREKTPATTGDVLFLGKICQIPGF